MNWRAAIGLTCVAPLAGCSLIETTARNLRNEPKLALEERQLEHRLRHDAKRTLHAIAQQHPKKVFTAEFRDGFEDGFSDFLDSGRIPIPPSLPPLKYRSNKYLNPEGHARVFDWFAGFKYGAEVAAATGMRSYYTVPVLVKEQTPPPPLNITVLPTPPEGLSTDPKPAGSPKPPEAKPAEPKPADAKPGASTPLPLPKVVDAAPPEIPKAPAPDKPNAIPTPAAQPAPVPVPQLPAVPKTSQLPPPANATPVTAMIPAPVPIPVTVTMTPPPAPVVRPQTGDLLPPPLTATAGK